MKKLISVLAVLAIILGMIPCSLAAEVQPVQNQTIEYFEDGSYVVTELEVTPSFARTTRSYTKRATYYTSSNVSIFSVNLTGNFNYTYNVSCTATSQSVSVPVHSSSATFVTKSSSRSGATVYGSGTVRYAGKDRTLSLSISCDKYGNIA